MGEVAVIDYFNDMPNRTNAQVPIAKVFAIAILSPSESLYRFLLPFQTEWWYYTGNLRAADGHRFGFELTFFRQGVSRGKTPASSLGCSGRLPGASRAQRSGWRTLLSHRARQSLGAGLGGRR